MGGLTLGPGLSYNFRKDNPPPFMPEGCCKHSALWHHLCPLYSFDGLIFKEAGAFYHVGWQGEAPGRQMVCSEDTHP